MPNTQPSETKNLDQYGNEPLQWSRAVQALDQIGSQNITWFLSAVDPDGAPHSAGVGAVWCEGGVYFVSGGGTRKSRDLKDRPAASVAVGLAEIDLVFEGSAKRITDHPTLERLAKHYREEGGWPAEVEGEGFTAPFTAPSAGPPPWNVYELQFDTVYGVAKAEPHGATRWRF
jgi:hypothetical protein